MARVVAQQGDGGVEVMVVPGAEELAREAAERFVTLSFLFSEKTALF